MGRCGYGWARNVHPAGLREEKGNVGPEKIEKVGLEEKKEPVRPAESEKTEEIREKEVPGGARKEKRARGIRGERKNRGNP